LQSVCGKNIEILDLGKENFHQGPDFFNAKILIDGQLWAGDIEVHIKASDWYLHKHHEDKKYDTVILHVVKEYDTPVFNSQGFQIPTIILSYEARLYEKFVYLKLASDKIPCTKFLRHLSKKDFYQWLDRVEQRRLEQKSDEVYTELKKRNNDWQEVFYIFLAKNFGFKQNSTAFSLLAKSLPLKYLLFHADNLMQIEAMLYGQAGMLEKECSDKYYLNLKREYEFLRHKYSLKPIDLSLWRYMRLRPANFPAIRIAQFANLVYTGGEAFSMFYFFDRYSDLYSVFEAGVSQYWKNHYDFCKQSKRFSQKKLSKSSIENIIINTISLFMYAYGKYNNDNKLINRALSLLKTIKPEKNAIIQKWQNAGILPKNAFETQALIQLYNEYCKLGKCLKCNIGNKIISII